MEKSQAVKIVTDVLLSIQKMSGRSIGELSGLTIPIGELEGFDSMCGVEASVMISEKVGFELPGVNSFINEQGNMALSINQIADRICRLSNGGITND